MTRSVFALCLLTLAAVAAPVPKETEQQKIEKKYGKIVDPKGDCKFVLDGDALKVTLPADKVRDLTDKIDTAPRLVQEVSGDFVLTVKVHPDLTADAVAGKDMNGAGGFLGGGLQFKCGEKKWFCQNFSRITADGKVFSRMPFQVDGVIAPSDYGCSGSMSGDPLFKKNPEALYLRCVRRGVDMTIDASVDLKTFTQSGKFRDFLPEDKVRVALFAHHGSNKEHTVTFSELKIEPLKAEKKEDKK